MTETIRCPTCGGVFTSSASYQNHTCHPRTLGGASDAGYSRERIGKTEGGTGER